MPVPSRSLTATTCCSVELFEACSASLIALTAWSMVRAFESVRSMLSV